MNRKMEFTGKRSKTSEKVIKIQLNGRWDKKGQEARQKGKIRKIAVASRIGGDDSSGPLESSKMSEGIRERFRILLKIR